VLAAYGVVKLMNARRRKMKQIRESLRMNNNDEVSSLRKLYFFVTPVPGNCVSFRSIMSTRRPGWAPRWVGVFTKLLTSFIRS